MTPPQPPNSLFPPQEGPKEASSPGPADQQPHRVARTDPRFTGVAHVDFASLPTGRRRGRWMPGDIRGGRSGGSAPAGAVVAESHIAPRLWPASQCGFEPGEVDPVPLRWDDLKGREPDRVFLFAHDIASALGYDDHGVAAPQALRALYALTEVGVVERYFVLPHLAVAYFVRSWERVRAADAVLRLSGKRALKKWIAEQRETRR